MALKSALGEIPENPTRFTGRWYQRLIWNGFSKGSCFISVSEATRADLHRFLFRKPFMSEVVYNGLAFDYKPLSRDESRLGLARFPASDECCPIVHVGNNNWYKNRSGVIEIYRELCSSVPNPPPLWMIGAKPTTALKAMASTVRPPGRVDFIVDATNEEIRAAYSIAELLIFPSLSEGFGWPIIEAMACGCAVATTAKAPMSEVGGAVAYYLELCPRSLEGRREWAKRSAEVVLRVMNRDATERSTVRARGLEWISSFQSQKAINAYEELYRKAIEHAQSLPVKP
jgi:glycosyltransferase involved in cell wall biosynthesis